MALFRHFPLYVVCALLLPGACQSRKREEALERREKQLNEREQQLVLKEKTLELKAAALQEKEQRLDSSAQTRSLLVDSTVIGTWNVRMTCTETTCAGSAVGDVKSETWHISNRSNTLLVKAMSNNQLVRVYSGPYTYNNIELAEDKVNNTDDIVTRMIVRLSVTDSLHITGQRVIARHDCKVIYSLQLEKERMKQ